MHTVLFALVLKYTVIMAGHPAGAQTVAVDGATRTIDFEFNDRGRGPKTHTVMSAGSMTTTGVDYLKVPVNETFAGGKWSNGAEAGSSANGKALYASMYGPPEENAAIARALLAAPNHRLPLLPAGEASIRKLGELTADGKKLTAYDIYGFGFSPAALWLDDKNELFASASSWLSIIAEGHDAAIPQLIKAQDEWHAAASHAIAAKLTHKPKGGGIVVTNARLFDPVSRKLTPNATIVIRGNKVESISGPDVPAFEHIDAAGRVVLPGLWDMHTHNAEEAVRDGYDEIQHINMLMLNFMPDVKETQTRLRLTAPAERSASIDLASPEVKAFIELLKEHHTVIDPTLGVFEGSYVARKGTIAPGAAAIADRLPPQVRRGLFTGGLPVPEGKDRTYRDSFANMERMVKMLYDAGVPIVAGTDGFSGFALHRELELYAQAGIPAPEVLRIATIGAAAVMHRDDKLGSIAPGKLADLVIVDGDPTIRISDVRNVRTVVKDGLVFDAGEVAASIGVKR